MTFFLLILTNRNINLRFGKVYTYIINLKFKMFYLKNGKVMVKVEFLGPINLEPIELDISNLKELADFMQKKPELKEWIGNSAVAVNDVIVNSIDYKLKSGDKISILPPVCGG
jgi:molybdopterin synthase sulfur carrier subunit